jgi:hypothetical protein
MGNCILSVYRLWVTVATAMTKATADDKRKDAELAEPLDASPAGKSKTFADLIREGHPHNGGLLMLARAEATRELFGGPGAAARANTGGDEEYDCSDPLVQWMRARGIVVTREAYLGLAYPDNLPEEWTAELEAGLPRFLQRPFPKV